jgi:molybdopterin-guanine dinucleotide biosynthesis protein A
MPPADPEAMDVTLAILAGGEARRMGFAKAEIRVGRRPILAYLLERFGWPGPTLLVTAPGRVHPAGWERFTREVSDPDGGQGPLRGVLTALESATTPIVVVTAVDMPRIGAEHLNWVVRELRGRPAAAGVMPRQRTMGEAHVQPFPSAFRAEAASAIGRALATNRRSLHGLLDDPAFVSAEVPDGWEDSVWTNLNTPADLDALGP